MASMASVHTSQPIVHDNDPEEIPLIVSPLVLEDTKATLEAATDRNMGEKDFVISCYLPSDESVTL